MKRLLALSILTATAFVLQAQTTLTEAVDFHVKTIEGDPIYLYPLLDDGKIVVIDFFSTSCGPCQDYAPEFQEAYEAFGDNESNVFFMGINWGDDNQGVHEFDSVFGLTYPSVSGLQGGGDDVYDDYGIISYPTVVIITPDHQIVEQYLWPPTAENIIEAVSDAGGLFVGIGSLQGINAHASVSPNPATTHAALDISVETDAVVRFQLVGMAGNVLYDSGKQAVRAGNTRFALPLDGLKNGMYFVKLTINAVEFKTYRFSLIR